MTKVFILILFSTTVVFSQQQKEIDSLHKLYNTFKNKDLNKAADYAYKAVILSEENVIDSFALISYHNYVEVLYKKREKSLSKEYITKLMNAAEKQHNEYFLCLSYLHLAKNNRIQRNYNESLIYIEKALVLADINNFIDLKHQILNSKSDLLYSTENKDKAIAILKRILKNNSFKNSTNLGYTYNILGASYFKWLKKKDSAAYYYKKGINILKNTGNDYLKTILYFNLGDLLLQTDYKKEGLNHLFSAKELAIKCKNFRILYLVSSSLGIYHHDNEQYTKAIQKYKEAEGKYGKYTEKRSLAHLYWLLSGSLYFNKQYKEGFEYQDKLLLLRDSLFTVEKNKTFERLQTEYEVEKKNNTIQLLEKEKELEANRKKLFFGIGGLLLFILGILVFVYRYKVKSQQLIRQQEQQLHLQEKEQLEQTQKLKHIEGYVAGEEKEKNRIAVELHDGIGGKLAGVKHFVSALSKTDETILLSKNITDITKEVRLLSHSLSYSYSLKQPLPILLEELREQYKNHFDIEIVLYPENEINAIANEKKLFLYRTIQELVNNTYKYAKATNITISLTCTDELSLLVEDNGIGFNPDITANGIGLQNIKEKLIKFTGQLDIDATLNNGTTIIVKLPK